MEDEFSEELMALFKAHGIKSFLCILTTEDTGAVMTGGRVQRLLDALLQACLEHPILQVIFKVTLKATKGLKKVERVNSEVQYSLNFINPN